MCKKSIVNAPRTLPISSPLKKKKKKKLPSRLTLHFVFWICFTNKDKTCSSALWLLFFIPYVPVYTFFHCIVRSYSMFGR